jgi:hypothetical protein
MSCTLSTLAWDRSKDKRGKKREALAKELAETKVRINLSNLKLAKTKAQLKLSLQRVQPQK